MPRETTHFYANIFHKSHLMFVKHFFRYVIHSTLSFPLPLFSYPMWNKVAPQHFHIWKLPLNRPREPYCSGITCIVHWMVIIVPDMRVVPFSRVPSGVSVQVIVTLGNSLDRHLHGCGLTMYMYVLISSLQLVMYGPMTGHNLPYVHVAYIGITKVLLSMWK